MRGHIRQRAKGSWTVVLSLGNDPATGKRRRQWVTFKRSKREAERRLVELVHQSDTAGFVKPSRMTLGEFLEQWLRDYAATNVRARTLEGYRSIIEGRLIPKIGRIPVTALTPANLQSYYADALVNGRQDGRPGALSARTVVSHHRVLSEALSHAVKWGLVARNVAQAVDPPHPRNKEMSTLGAEGIRRLLEAAQRSVYYPLIHLAVYTGLRRSEFLGLRWKDVDLVMGTVSVSHVMHMLRGGKGHRPCSNSSSLRRVSGSSASAQWRCWR